jgi:NO-binding membrane sensor protein with MHYT domain
MHFIGMGAMIVQDQHGHKVDVYFDIPITIASLLVAILTAMVGIYILSFDRLFAKSQQELFDMFVDDLKHLPFDVVRRSKSMAILQLITTKSMGYVVIGGIVTAVGVCVMHYVGMSAMTIEGRIEWDAGIVSSSVFVALFAAVVAFWILFRLLSIYPRMEYLRILCAMVMGMAVCGMHYTGMDAARFIIDADIDQKAHADEIRYSRSSSRHVSMDQIIVPVIVCAMFVLWIIAMIVFADLRKMALKYQSIVKRSAPDFILATAKSPDSSVSGEGNSKRKFFRRPRVVTPSSSALTSSNSTIAYSNSDLYVHDPIEETCEEV